MIRYFLVIYSGSSIDGRTIVNSNINVISEDGKFPSREFILSTIKDRHHDIFEQKDPLISNIMELSEIDWKDYIR